MSANSISSLRPSMFTSGEFQARAQQGGHSASEKTLRHMYKDSLENLPKALRAFDHSMLYDSAGPEPRLVVEIRQNRLHRYEEQFPMWVEHSLREAVDPYRSHEDFQP